MTVKTTSHNIIMGDTVKCSFMSAKLISKHAYRIRILELYLPALIQDSRSLISSADCLKPPTRGLLTCEIQCAVAVKFSQDRCHCLCH